MFDNFFLTQYFDIVTLQWFGILFCISQSAMFSGLNLAFFSLSRLQLEVEVSQGNKAAVKILNMRQDSNFLLATILWGNVGINVLLTLLSNSLLTGISAFVFSTVVITFLGEIIPQAYFSRNALRMASMLSPILRFYQILFYPVAKTSSIMLDLWLGKEGIDYLRDKDLRSFITKHIEAEEADVDHIEGVGALNFLAIDDISVTFEGERINSKSIIKLPVSLDLPIMPSFERTATDPFLQQVNASGHNWVVLTDMDDEPRLIMDADGFLRAAIFDLEQPFDPYHYCHRPLIVRDMNTPMGDIIPHIRGAATKDQNNDGEIEHDVVLVWGEEKRIITGADILGRLFKGIGHKAYEAVNINSHFSNEISNQDS